MKTTFQSVLNKAIARILNMGDKQVIAWVVTVIAALLYTLLVNGLINENQIDEVLGQSQQ